MMNHGCVFFSIFLLRHTLMNERMNYIMKINYLVCYESDSIEERTKLNELNSILKHK